MWWVEVCASQRGPSGHLFSRWYMEVFWNVVLRPDRKSQQISASAGWSTAFCRRLISVTREPGPWTLMTSWCKFNGCLVCFCPSKITFSVDPVHDIFLHPQAAACIQFCRDPLLLSSRGNWKTSSDAAVMFSVTREISGQMSVKKSSVWLIFPLLDPDSEKLDIQTSK